MDTLTSRISSQTPFSDLEKAQLFDLLGKRCREETKTRLWSRINLPLSLWPSYGIFNRIHLDQTRVSYCAGQSYPDEIRLVRSLILKG